MDPQGNNLSVDIVERVLSFVPIPTICKMRVVCKEWNELTHNATFHALCNKNGKNEDYLFLWRKDISSTTGYRSVSPRFGATFHVFDLEMERWYSLPTTPVRPKPTYVCGRFDERGEWFLSMDHGLVCEALPIYHRTELEKRTLSLSILDPVAKTGKELPSPNLHFPLPSTGDIDPSLVTVVDQVTHSYKVFFFNTLEDKPLAYVLEQGTQIWQSVGGLPHCEVGGLSHCEHCEVDVGGLPHWEHCEGDVIAFRNTAFVAMRKGYCRLRLFRYQQEGNTFTKVWRMEFPRMIEYCKLVVRYNRLFVLVITRPIIYVSDSEEDFFDSEFETESYFPTCLSEKGALFELYEILLDEGTAAKPIVQFTENSLRAVWGYDICSHAWLAFPCLDSHGGACCSVVLVHHHSGEMRRFHLATQAVDVLPACPLSSTIPDGEDVISSFDAKTMPLSLRDVLKHAPPTV